MDYDFWLNIFIRCKTNDVLNCRLVCKNSKIKIDEEHFWKVMMRRNFRDIHKLNQETWLSYYKRRSINYGIPIIIDKKEKLLHFKNVKSLNKDYCKFTFDMIDNNILKCFYDFYTSGIFILNKQHQLCSFEPIPFEDEITFLEGFNVTNVEISYYNVLFFVDDTNNLYQCNRNMKTILLDKNVKNIFKCYSSDTHLYYTKECGTYKVSHEHAVVKIFDELISDYLRSGKYEYYINNENQLWERIFNDKEYKYRKFGLNAKQLARINHEHLIVLGTNGFITISNEKDRIEIDIPNVASISENAFLTENGDLYCFDENLKPVLIDTDVVNIGNFRSKCIRGCYVKRHF